MVVMSRQQLFTESASKTAVLPIMAEFKTENLTKMARMWGVVLAANLVGTFFAALFTTFTPTLTSDLYGGMLDISRHILGHGFPEMFFRGIAAGFLIAAMVWLIPSAEGSQFHVIVLMTYLISAGSFMHIVAGSVEAFLLVLAGELNWLSMLTSFVVPVLAGQHNRRHCIIRPDRLRTGHGGDLSSCALDSGAAPATACSRIQIAI